VFFRLWNFRRSLSSTFQGANPPKSFFDSDFWNFKKGVPAKNPRTSLCLRRNDEIRRSAMLFGVEDIGGFFKK